MTLEQNKALVRRWLEAINAADVGVTDEVFSPDCIRRQIYHASMTRVGRGPQAIKRRIGEWLVAFPDWQFTVEDMLAEGDVVMTRCTVRGTHRGELFGLPPTGREVAYTEILISRVAEGRIIEQSVLIDRLGLLQELGALPETVEILLQARAPT
jgi:predicted ester cyclase